jgi:hypothetical protein
MTMETPRGELLTHWHNPELELRLTKAEAAEFEQAKVRGYVTTAGYKRNLEKVWFACCKATGQPYIRVDRGPRYSVVGMDLAAQGWSLSEESMVALRTLAMDPKWLILGNAQLGASSSGDHRFVLFTGIANRLAGEVAEVLLQEALRSRSVRGSARSSKRAVTSGWSDINLGA